MIDTSLDISIENTPQSRVAELDQDNLKFGRQFSDHMFIADYRDGQWQELRIVPFGPMEFNPALAVIHYGQTIFEGLKAYRSDAGQVRVFRPSANWARFNLSAERMCMPTIPEEIFVGGLKKLLQLDEAWVPNRPQSSLYIRPFMFATDEYIGIRPSDTYRFMIFTSPVGAYYSEPVRVKIETEYTRAFPGGTGYAKSAGNYAGALYPTVKAQKQGFHQLIWTDGLEHKYIEEAGTMNLAFVIDGKLISPQPSETILHGITRNSLLQMARDLGISVEERRVTVDEVVTALRDGKMQEAFGIGTAATLAPIAMISYQGEELPLPSPTDNAVGDQLRKALDDLRYGRAEDPHGWLMPIE
ncbi:branched-chain amino acid aminotransferase [Catalinimonas alkaloidigena]|nr:branched-chain amino acid aminotransferase [Catalinimonas alkaloidigena]